MVHVVQSKVEHLPQGSLLDAAKEEILAVAERVFLEKGLEKVSMSDVKQVLEAPHRMMLAECFADESALLSALVQRYIEHDKAYFKDLFYRASFLCSDPLEQIVLFTNLLSESIVSQSVVERGCLLAACAQRIEGLNAKIQQQLSDGVGVWRESVLERLEAVAALYPANIEVNLEALCDMLISLLQGGIILSRLVHDPSVVTAQIQHFRNYLRLLFEPEQT